MAKNKSRNAGKQCKGDKRRHTDCAPHLLNCDDESRENSKLRKMTIAPTRRSSRIASNASNQEKDREAKQDRTPLGISVKTEKKSASIPATTLVAKVPHSLPTPPKAAATSVAAKKSTNGRNPSPKASTVRRRKTTIATKTSNQEKDRQVQQDKTPHKISVKTEIKSERPPSTPATTLVSKAPHSLPKTQKAAATLGVAKKSRKRRNPSPKTYTERKRKTPNKDASNGYREKAQESTGPALRSGRKLIFLDLDVSCEQRILSNGTCSTYLKNTVAALLPTPQTAIERSASNLNSNGKDSSGSVDETCKSTSKRRSRKGTITSRRPSVSIHSVQPVIRRRTIPLSQDISNVDLAKKSLHSSEVPMSLPCREKEFKEIFDLMKNKILDNSGGCVYVCGVPGTGKTATVATVIRSLQLQSNEHKLPQFELIQLNGMQLTEPQQAYVHIYRHLTGKKVRWDEAVSLLEKFFENRIQHKPAVLVADEFDMLKSPGQRVIYNLLNWAMPSKARLIVVAIGNIVDVERMGGVTSRLGMTRFTFRPYTQNQLQAIVLARLDAASIYEKDAIELVARKVASISGDCRRALDICRRAIEIGERDNSSGIIVSMSHVMKAFEEMICNPKVAALKGCSKYEKFFLQAVLAEISRTGAEETVLFQVYRQFETICALNGAAVPDPGIALRLSSRLGSSRLLICEHSSNSIHQKIMLNVTDDEMRYALEPK